jgi:hypothetical protein
VPAVPSEPTMPGRARTRIATEEAITNPDMWPS